MQERSQVRLLLELHELQTDSDDLDRAEARRRIEESLEPSLLGRYRNLKKRKGTAVAVLKNCTCSECMIIYPKDARDSSRKGFCAQLRVLRQASPGYTILGIKSGRLPGNILSRTLSAIDEEQSWKCRF
jgi:hypothetical protein